MPEMVLKLREEIMGPLARGGRDDPEFRAALRRAAPMELKAAMRVHQDVPGHRPERRAIELRYRRLARRPLARKARAARERNR